MRAVIAIFAVMACFWVGSTAEAQNRKAHFKKPSGIVIDIGADNGASSTLEGKLDRKELARRIRAAHRR